MNLLCDIHDFKKNNISFLDTKKNMVIDGFFTKLIYTDANISLNGLYLYFPIPWIQEDRPLNKPLQSSAGIGTSMEQPLYDNMFIRQKKMVISFLIDDISLRTIEDFIRMEYEIIEYYKEFFKVNKPAIYSLKNQLKQDKTVLWYSQDINPSKPLVLKISGVWETQTNIGITYKFHI